MRSLSSCRRRILNDVLDESGDECGIVTVDHVANMVSGDEQPFG